MKTPCSLGTPLASELTLRSMHARHAKAGSTSREHVPMNTVGRQTLCHSTCTQECPFTHTHTRTHTHTHTHVHTYTHTHAHKHVAHTHISFLHTHEHNRAHTSYKYIILQSLPISLIHKVHLLTCAPSFTCSHVHASMLTHECTLSRVDLDVHGDVRNTGNAPSPQSGVAKVTTFTFIMTSITIQYTRCFPFRMFVYTNRILCCFVFVVLMIVCHKQL